ncbi:TPA: hypothetical protein DCE37_21370 [Candidatus Latescibacteria bacterium]|nr:hypothetical protein [Candidatus Latescibacterota bacterium]
MPLHRSFHDLAFTADCGDLNPFLGLRLQVSFIRDDGEVSIAEGFYNGGGTFRARAYCDTEGEWEWHSSSNVPELDAQSDTSTVEPSGRPGKLRIHPDDPYQFAYNNGDWFLHTGDSRYLYVTSSEPEWQAYIDQAIKKGGGNLREPESPSGRWGPIRTR